MPYKIELTGFSFENDLLSFQSLAYQKVLLSHE